MEGNPEAVLRVIRQRQPVTSKEIVERTGLSKRAVSVAVGKLCADGLTERHGEEGEIRSVHD